MAPNSTCIAKGCKNKREFSSLFSLPKEPDRLMEWLHKLGRQDLLQRLVVKPKSYGVCSKHFEKDMIVTWHRLRPDAIPTQNLWNKSSTSLTIGGNSSESINDSSSEITTIVLSDDEENETDSIETSIQNNMKTEIRILKIQLKKSETERRFLMTRIDNLNDELQCYKGTKQGCIHQASKADEINKIRNELHNFEVTKTKLENDLAKIKTELENTKASLQTLSCIHQASKVDEIYKIRNELHNSKVTKTKLENDLAKIKTELENTKASNTSLQTLSAVQIKKLSDELCDSICVGKNLRNQLDKIKKEYENNRKQTLTHVDEQELDEVTKRFYKLIKWQKKYKNNPKRQGLRYDPDYVYFALNLYFLSPQTYRSLKSFLELPSEKTLSKLNLRVRPEPDDKILNYLVSKLQTLPDKAKYCTLCVKGMKLKRHLYYDISNDEVVGLHHINENVTNEIASHVYVIMLRGITVNWNQPIAYAFLAGAKHYDELDKWLNDVITKLLNHGIHIKAVISNQNSNFDKYIKNHKHVTKENPYFDINGSYIYYICDVPDLLNNARNGLLNNDLYYDDNHISWAYIKAMYSYQKEQNLQCVPKVTDDHIEPNNTQKSQVKYAAQVFSHSVFSALNVFVSAQLLPSEALPTAAFVDMMNKLFDILNSYKGGVGNNFKKAFSLNEDHISLLETALNIFGKITVSNTTVMKTLYNFQLTIQAVIMLSKDLRKKHIKCIFTKRLNQEPLKNLFSAIREKSGNRQKLTAIKFARSFSALFLANISESSPTRKRAGLADLLLRNFDKLVNTTTVPESPMVCLGGETDYRFDLPNEIVSNEVASYLLLKCRMIHKCPAFDKYIKNTRSLTNTSLLYTRFKNLNKKGFSFTGTMKEPPTTFLKYIEKLENEFNEDFYETIRTKPANEMLKLLQNVEFRAPCVCFPSEYLLKLFVRFRLYATLRFNNQFLKNSKTDDRFYIRVKHF